MTLCPSVVCLEPVLWEWWQLVRRGGSNTEGEDTLPRHLNFLLGPVSHLDFLLSQWQITTNLWLKATQIHHLIVLEVTSPKIKMTMSPQNVTILQACSHWISTHHRHGFHPWPTMLLPLSADLQNVLPCYFTAQLWTKHFTTNEMCSQWAHPREFTGFPMMPSGSSQLGRKTEWLFLNTQL